MPQLPNKYSYFAHYASKYYDPTKAHEYYEKNKELVGRSARNLTDEGKDIWRTTKSNITESQSRVLKAEQEAHKIKMDGFRESSKAARETISNRLREVLQRISERKAERLTSETKETKKDIDRESKRLEKKQKQTKSSIEKLMAEDYSNLPDELRDKKIAERSEKVNSLRGSLEKKKEKVSDKKEDIREDSTSDKESIRKEAGEEKSKEGDSAKVEREKISTDLKQSLSTSRDAYIAAKESIRAGFKTTFNSEFDAIASEHGSDSEGTSTYKAPPKKTDAEKAKIRKELSEERVKK